MAISPATSIPAQQATTPSARLTGWLSAGMLDWPGRVAGTLFISGCQMQCPYCHNPDLVQVHTDSAQRVWSEVVDYLQRRRAWVDGVVVTGGEPTSDPDLLPLLERLSSAGIPVKLDTNGLRPDVLKTVLKRKLASYVALDLKASKDGYRRLTDVADAGDRVAECAMMLMRSGIDHEFRTTCVPDVVGLDEIVEIARSVRGGSLYALQQFRPNVTLDPARKDVQPYAAAALTGTAHACAQYLPTITRGV